MMTLPSSSKRTASIFDVHSGHSDSVILGNPFCKRRIGEPPKVVSGCMISNFSFLAGANVAVLTMVASSRVWVTPSIINLFGVNHLNRSNGCLGWLYGD